MLSPPRSFRLRRSIDPSLNPQFWRHFLAADSLTVKLKAAAMQALRVNVLAQGLLHSNRELPEAIGLVKRQVLWRRHTQLLVDDVVWIEALTCVPLQQLQPAARQLLLLKNRPLGERLFQDPHLQRSPFTVSYLNGLPTRQSCFKYLNTPIHLLETFQPAAIAYFSAG